jgi:hypothetical protein
VARGDAPGDGERAPQPPVAHADARRERRAHARSTTCTRKSRPAAAARSR